MSAVERLGREHVDEVTEVLSDAFAGYPVMRYLLAGCGDVPERTRRLVRFWVMARLLRGEPVFGAHTGSRLGAAALVSYPAAEHPPELVALGEAMWAEVGETVRARYLAFGAAVRPLLVEAPHIHLNMIGVRSRTQGSGLGRRLLEHVHQHALEVAGSRGVSLHTEDPGNVPLYEHFGYEVTGRVRVAPDLETWALFRPNPRPS